MLIDLHIRNLAVVENAVIAFGDGFNVLSGETGAGKSIVVDSLALLGGVRASSDLIRTGADTLVVTGVFAPDGARWRAVLHEAGLEPQGDEVVVRREIQRSGRNRVFVDDHPVTLKLLADLAPSLLRIHGQREELGLVEPELQRTWLDRCGGAPARDLLARVAAAHDGWRALADKLERLTGDERIRAERIDLLRFQIGEIDRADLETGEEDELRREREVLRHAEAIRDGLTRAVDALFGDEAATERVVSARQALRDVSAWEEQASTWAGELDDVAIRLGELETDVQRRLDEVESDPLRLDAVEERLATLERLFRKYGATSAEVLEQHASLVAELDELEDAEGGAEALRDQAAAALESYRTVAEELSAARRGWAEQLEELVGSHLGELALGKALFRVDFGLRRRDDSPLHRLVDDEAVPVEFGPLGFDQVTYLFAPNPGEEPRPLARVASGGELSRLYLAVQLASRGVAAVGDETARAGATLVFDEVDAGISGAEAATLGAKLRRLAEGGQVLAVTHLPQVASCADVHFRVRKRVDDGRTRTAVETLDADGRIDEVARMIAGSELTETSREHARSLIVGAGASLAD
ncbi:MAG: DNA repair protein RecN [Acidobacteriota bacterium]